MGTRKFHLARADHHLTVATHLAQTKVFEDWAVVALFYAAHEKVHSALSGDPTLPKDERHARKHNSYGALGTGGRGTNQLVRDLFPRHVHLAYRSLMEGSHRTRYDMTQLDAYARFLDQYEEVAKYCDLLNATRADISTQAP